MKESRHDTWTVREYSLAEYLDAATAKGPSPENESHGEAKIQRGEDPDGWRVQWRGGTLQEARTLRSWPAGREKMNRINLDGAKLPAPVSIRRVRRWGEDGDEFSRDRFDAGRLDCWKTRCRQRTVSGSTIRVTIELCANWRKTPEQLMWSGLAAAKLADKLEHAGYRVEIAVTASNSDLDRHGYRCVEIIHVKRAEDPLNLDALLMAVAHPLFFRFVVFSSWLRYPVRCSPCLGYPADTPTGLRGDIHIAKVFDKAGAEQTVAQAIAKQELTP